MAVGYGHDGLSYFKIRNSWGSGWGERGYIRLSQNGGSQGTACLLQNSPVYPVLSVGPTPTPTPPTPTPPTPTPPSDFILHEGGFIPNSVTDLEKSSMTIDAAKEHCKALAGCKGFTIHDTVEQTGETTVWFKNDWDFRAAGGWTAFEKSEGVLV